jgi:hypothetical protein
VAAYNSALHRIVTKMRLCGQKITDADMIEKTLSTFHPGNIVLQQQYRNSKYHKYSELSEVLSATEQQNEVLMSNHSARPTGSIDVPEAHANVAESSRNQIWGCGKGKWNGKRGALFKGKVKRKPKGKIGPEKERGDHSGEEQGKCYRCRAKGHRSRKCRCRCFRPANLPRGTRGSRLCGEDRDRETENSKVCARTRGTRFIQVRVAKVANPTSCLGDQVWRPALGVGLFRVPARYPTLLYIVQGAGS